MAIDNFIPVVWSASLLRNLHKALVYGQAGVINRDYEGDLKDTGDSVKINNIGPVTIGNYSKNTNISDPEALSSAQQALVIDQSKFFNFQIDDIDAAQTKPKVMDEGMYEAAYGLANVADSFLANLFVGLDTGNLVGSDASPIALAASNAEGSRAYDYLVSLKVKLDKASVPSADRWVVVPPDFEGLLLKDSRFVSFGTPENRMAIQQGVMGGSVGALNGQVGQAAGFNVLRSNNAPQTDSSGNILAGNANWNVIAGHSIAWTYAEQINKVEAYRPPLRFADAIKGLHLYGAKLVRPSALSVLKCTVS